MPNLFQPAGHFAVVPVTLSADTSILADNDVIAASQEVTNFFRVPGGAVRLHSVMMLDGDDQNTDVDLIFLNANGSIGAENAAFAVTDVVAATIVGYVSMLASTYIDFTDSRWGYLANIDQVMLGGDTSSVWVGAICRSGTPTYTAAGLTLKLGIERY